MPTTQTVTIAQALASSSSGLLVDDTAANIANALPNAALVSRVTSFTVSGPASLTLTQLLNLASLGSKLIAPAGDLQLGGTQTISEAQLATLEAMPGFTIPAGAKITLSDTTTYINSVLTAHPSWVSNISSFIVTMHGNPMSAVAAGRLEALSTSGHTVSFVPTTGHTVLPIYDSVANLVANVAALNALQATQPMSFSIASGATDASAASAASLVGLNNFDPAAQSFTISDTGANISAVASTIFGKGFTSITVASGNFSGTVAQLLDSTLSFATGSSATLGTSGTTNAAGLAALAALPNFSEANGVVLTLSDTAANLLALSAPELALAGAASLTASATVTAAQFTTLKGLAHFSLGGFTLSVTDTAANLLALTGSNSLASSMTLSANATLSVAQLNSLRALPGFSTGGNMVVVDDTAANLLSLSQAALALVTGTALSANASVTVAQLNSLKALPQFALNGASLTVVDTATNLLAASQLSPATATALSANATVTAAQLTALAALPSFSAGGHTLAVSDSATNLLALSPSAVHLASSVTLNANATLTAAQLQSLSGDPGFSAGGHTLSITDTAANLATLSAAQSALASSITLSASGTVTAAQFTSLQALAHFSLGSFTLTILDNAANLLGLSGSLALASAVNLSANATVTAAQYTSLTGLAHFALNGHTLAIVDNAANLAALSSTSLADAVSETLSGNASVTAAVLKNLAAESGFTRGSYTLVVNDTAANILTLTAPQIALATGFTLSAPVTLSVAQFTVLRALPNLGGAAISLSDSASNLLGLSGSTALISATALNAAASVTAAQLTQLEALPAFSNGGQTLAVTDTASNLLALSAANLVPVTSTILSASASVTAAQLMTLANDPGFSLGGHTLSVSDTAANLLTLSAGALALVSAVQLSANATLTAAQLQTLAAEPGFSAGSHTLAVVDTAANILSLTNAQAALASSLTLSANASVTAAGFSSLRSLAHFGLGSYSLTISDTAANLLALTGSLSLASATVLSANASVSVANYTALRVLPGFGTGGHMLSVTDTAANLLTLVGSNTSFITSTVLSANATVTAAQEQSMTALPGFGNGFHTLIVADTAANLLTLTATQAGFASALDLTANATVTVQNFTALRAFGNFATNGFTLSIADTAANLLNLSGSLSLASSIALSANATVSAAQYASLIGLAGFTTAGHSLAIVDSAANLAAIAGDNLGDATSETLAGNATVSVAVAKELASESGFSAGSYSLTISDTAANLATLTNAQANIASLVSLSASASVSAAIFTELRALPHFSLGGYSLTLSDTAANLLALSGSLSLASAVVLDANATVTAAQYSSLIGLPAFSNGGYTLTVSDTGTNLAALAGSALSQASALVLSANSVVSVAQAVQLASEAHFSTGGHTLTITDTAANLVTLTQAQANLASAITLSANATLNVANYLTYIALPHLTADSFSITVADTAANILAILPDSALTQNVTLTANASLTVANYLALTSLAHFSPGSYSLNLVDSAANLLAASPSVLNNVASVSLAADATVSVAQAQSLEADADFSTGGHNFIIADTLANLLTLTVSQAAYATSLTLTANAMVNAAQFTLLQALPHLSLNGHSLTLADTASNLLALTGSLAAASATTLTANATVTASQYSALMALPGFTDGSYTLNIVDTAANIAALPLSSLGDASSETLSANATVTVAQIQALANDPNFSEGAYSLTIADTAAHLFNLTLTQATMASAITLTGNATVTVAVFNALRGLPGFSNGGNSITIVDTASNLLSLTGSLANATATMLSANATVTGAQYQNLIALPSFSAGTHSLIISDTAATLAALASTNLSYATSETLSASATITAAQANALASEANFTKGSYNLIITDTASNLLSLTQGAAALASAIDLSTGCTVTAANFAILRALPHFQTNGNSIIVADTAANLLAISGSTASITATQLSANATVSAAQYGTLIGLPGFSDNGYSVTITDSAANLAGLATQNLSYAAHEWLSASATISASQLQALASEDGFALNGHSLTVTDNAANLLGLSNAQTALASAFNLSQNSIVSAANFTALRALSGFSDNGFTLTVNDTAQNLLALTGSLTLATAMTLSANATVNASQYLSLIALPGFATSGHVITITDTASNLAALASDNLSYATSETLSGNAVISVQTAQLLASESGFSTGTYGLTIADTAANLLTLTNAQAALASTIELTQNETVTAQNYNKLAALPHFSTNSYALAVVDSAANLLTLTGSAAFASAVSLNANATVSAASYATLIGLPGFSDGGHLLAVVDSGANLAALASLNLSFASSETLSGNATLSVAQLQALASESGFSTGGYNLVVQDTAANLAALTNAQTAFATSITLSANSSVTAAQYTALLALPHFSTGSYSITINDTAANLAALASANLSYASAETLSATATVNVAQATELASESGFSAGSFALIIADSAGNLLTLSNAAAALAGAIELTGPCTLSAAQFSTLRALPHFLTNGYAITVTDTAANLLALTGSLNDITTSLLSANAGLNAAQYSALIALPGFSDNNFTVTITDTAANLAALATQNLSFANSELLSGSAIITGAQLQALAAETGFSTNGYSLTVNDTAAHLLSLTAPQIALASAFTLSQNASVNVANFTTLRALPSLSDNGYSLTITDTAQNLLALSGSLSLATGITLSANASLTASQYLSLIALPNFATGGHAITVTDTAANLAALASDNLSYASSLTLSANATISVQTAQALASESGFSTGSYSLTIADTAAHLITLTSAQAALAGTIELIQNETVTAQAYNTLAALPHFSTNSFTLAVSDSAAHLLSLPASPVFASSVSLNADASVTAANYSTLIALPNFSDGGHVLVISDTAANLASLASANLAFASAENLSADAVVSVAQLQNLASESGFSRGTHALVALDTAANLATLTNAQSALATAIELSANATVSAATFTLLQALPSFSTNSFSLTISDTAANLLQLSGSLSLASAVTLTQNATVTAAQFLQLSALPGFSDAGHSLTVTDSASNLAGLASDNLSNATSEQLSQSATINVATAQALASEAGFSLNNNTLIIADSAQNLLTLTSAQQALAASLQLNASASLNAAQFAALAALSHFSTNGYHITLSDTAANLLAYSGSWSLATAISLSAGATVTAANYLSLIALPNFSDGGYALNVVDSAANLAALAGSNLSFAASETLSGNATISVLQAQQLASESGFSTGSYSLTISDSASQLISLTNGQAALASAITLSANATLDAADFATLRALPHISTGGHALIIADTPANLLALTGSLTLPTQITLNANATVNAAQYLSLIALPHFSDGTYSLTINDTAANLAALASDNLSFASSETLSNSATITQAQAQALAALPNFSTNGQSLTISDSAADLELLTTAQAALASAIMLNASATVTVQNFNALRALPHFATGSYTLGIIDTAQNLLTLSGSLALASAITLSGDASLSASQAGQLLVLSGFSNGGHMLTITDTAANLAALSSDTLTPVTAMLLSASATISATQLQELAGEPGFSVNGHTLTVSDTAAAIAGLTNSQATMASQLLLSGPATVSVSLFDSLRALSNFATGGYALTISDSAANLATLSGSLALASATSLNADTTLGAAALNNLTGTLPNFSAGGHVLTVSDTVANLLTLTSASLAVASAVTLSSNATLSVANELTLINDPHFTAGSASITVADTAANLIAMTATEIAAASAITLSSNQTVTAQNFASLRALPNFSTGSNSLTIADTAANLLGLTGSTALATATSLSAAAQVSAAQFLSLSALPSFTNGGYSLTISDTATNLGAIAGDNLSQVSGVSLSADATISTTQAQLLYSEPNFSAGGHNLTITGTPTALLALSAGLINSATSLLLSGNASVSAATLASLVSLGSKFSEGTHSLTCSDTASNLASLSNSEVALLGATQLSTSATVTAATAATLAGLPHFSLANSVVLVVQDNVTNLLALGQTMAGLATTEQLPSGTTTITASQGAALSALPNFSNQNATIIVSDTIANLTNPANTGWASVASATHVVDTAANLVAAASTALVDNASQVSLSAAAQVNAATASTLRSIPNFSAGGLLSVSDTASAIAGAEAAIAALGVTAQVNMSGTLSASAAASLAVLNAAGHLSFASGAQLTVTDTAANLLNSSYASGVALATNVILSANANVSAAQAEALAAEPNFSLGTATLTITDTAENLVALPLSLKIAASALVLSQSETISASELAGIAALGVKFSEGSHTLICSDTAANLAALNAADLALLSGEVLSTSAVVSASLAASLAALTNFSLANGVTLTVQDTVANLIALGSGAPAGTTLEQLAPGSVVTITAAQAAALHALSHFSASGATITISDTVAGYQAATANGYQSIATAIDVADTAANLATNEGLALVQSANLVTLTANATVTAAVAGALALIPGFTTGNYRLTVSDTATNIAAHADAIVAIATSAIVTDSGPVSANQADELAIIANADLLIFHSGVHLQVEDSFANLTSNANASGLALAATITVQDTAANIISAAAYDWIGIAPYFVLSAGGNITAAQATSLAAIGSHYSNGGYSLVVNDSAANVVGATSAINSLGLSATVSDSVAAVTASESGLLSLGSALTGITLTNSSAVTPAQAAALAPLASKLTGSALLVAGSATQVDSNLANLVTLGSHVAITITDSAADIGSYAADIATLGTHATIVLNDSAAVSPSVAAALAPVASQLSNGSVLAVTGQGSAIAAAATNLATLGTHLGTVTLSDGTSVSVATAAAISAIDSHLANGVTLAVSGSATAITANITALEQLQTDGRLASVTDANEAATNITASAVTALNAVHASVTISDTGADITGNLANLAALTGLGNITLTDMTEPTLSITMQNLTSYNSVLTHIMSPYYLSITGTPTQIATDIGLGASSLLLSHASAITSLTTTSGPLVLTQAQDLHAGINDSSSAVLANFSGSLTVTNVDVNDLNSVAGGQFTPTSIDISDTASDISNDLALGASSVLLANRSLIKQITPSDGNNISLTASEALYSGVADGASSALAYLQGAHLVVTNAAVSQLSALSQLYVVPTQIAVNDTAQHIENDIAGGSSLLIAGLPGITTIHVSDGMPIVLTETQVLATHVDDGTGSVLSEVSGGNLQVTNVAAGDVTEILGLNVAPTSITVNDTSSALQTNIGTLASDISDISAITDSSGTLTLTADEVLSAHVDDGANSVIGKLTGHVFDVTNATVLQTASLIALGYTPASINVADTSSHIAADLASGSSTLVAALSTLGTITVTGGTLSLTDAQADYILAHASADNVMAKLASATIVSVSAVPVSDLAAIAASGWPHVSIAVTDSVEHITADLNSGASVLQANSAEIGSVTLTDGGTVNATILNDMAALPSFSTGGYGLTVVDGAAAIFGLSAGAVALSPTIDVSDTGSDVGSYITDLHSRFGSGLSITLSDGNGFSVGAATYTTDKSTIDVITNTGLIEVTDTAADLVPLISTLTSDTKIGTVVVQDTAADVVANLSTLEEAGSKLSISLTDSTLSAAVLAPLIAAGVTLNGVTVSDTGSAIAAAVETANANVINYMNSYGAALSGNSIVGAADLKALSTLSNFSTNGHTINVWDTAANLTNSTYLTAINNSGLVNNIYLKANNNAATISAAEAASLLGLSNFYGTSPGGTPVSITIADTAANLLNSYGTIHAGAAPAINDITNVKVTNSASVTYTQLQKLQTLNAVLATGASLTVTDNASGLLSAAAAEGSQSSDSLTGSSYMLSTSASESLSNVLALVSLPNFSTGSATLTLTSGGSVTVAQANELGGIAGGLHLGGNTLSLAGSVSSLAGLSSAASHVVSVALSDSLANVAALSASSPLLSGTVEITDSAAITISQASSFLTLMHTALGANLTGLTIDNVHDISDTAANLISFAESTAWTQNPTIQSKFLLELSASANIDTADATILANLTNEGLFSAGSYGITITDTASNLIAANQANILSIASSVWLSGPTSIDAADATTLLGISAFHLDSATELTIADSAADLLSSGLASAITNSGFGAYINVELAAPETVDAATATALVNLPGFVNNGDLNIADDATYLINSTNLAAENAAESVTLLGDDTVSAATILRLSEVPHFTPGSSELILASNDFADAPTLKAIADFGTSFENNGHSITLTSDVLNLTPQEFTNLQMDDVIANGHAMGITPTVTAVSDTANTLSVTISGESGATVKIYASDGSLLSSHTAANASYTVTASDTVGSNFAITETVGASTNEGAPIVVLDAHSIESTVASLGGSFASSGSIQVDSGKYINLYEVGSVPNGLNHAALVYDPNAHTISLDVPGQSAVTLITLGGTTHPTSLDASEILFKTHS